MSAAREIEATEELTESDAERGRRAARQLLDADEHPGAIEEFAPAFAEAALDEINRMQERKLRGIPRRIIRGANRSARNIRVEPAHGLIEVIQNADDQGATEVRVAVRRRRGGRDLLVVHNGSRIRLDHVVGMVFPFVTTKLDDADTIGRYGIGLKTLRRLGEPITAHCAPFHFRIDEEGLERVAPAAALPGFYDPDGPETLLTVALKAEYGDDFFRHWFKREDASSLLFLRSVRKLALLDLRTGAELQSHGLTEASRKRVFLTVGDARRAAERVTFRDLAGTRRWTRYSMSVPTVAGIVRSDKQTGAVTPISLAVPSRPARGRIYAGLPLSEPSTLPYSFDAHFDPDEARTHLQENPWNQWLLEGVRDLATGVALHRFAEKPSTGWSAVALSSETAGESGGWLAAQIERLVEQAGTTLANRIRFTIRGEGAGIHDLAYADDSVAGLLTDEDVEFLEPHYRALPAEHRDSHARWQAVLEDLEAGVAVTFGDLLRRLGENRFSRRDARWFIDVGCRAIEAGSIWLDSAPWILTASGSRLSPSSVRTQRVLLVERLQSGLAERLGLATQIAPAYRGKSPAATKVRRWLRDKNLVQPAPTTSAAIEALSGQRSGEPVDLSSDDDVLLEIRDTLDALPADRREAIGRGIGRNIAVAGFTWVRGKRSKQAVRPSDAYLPRALDTAEDGFPAAAARTPGIQWIEPRYAKLFRGAEEQDGASSRRQPTAQASRRRSGARATFSLLGAEVSPRLAAVTERAHRYSSSAVRIPWPRSVEHQEALNALNISNAHLEEDWVSPDLEAVTENIAAERSTKGRRARGAALLATLGRRTNWPRLYEGRVRVSVVSYFGQASFYTTTSTVRATWAAHAASTPWLTNQSGNPKAPRDLALRTDGFMALYDEQPDLFVWGLDDTDADLPVLDALAIEGRPKAETIIERLEMLRDSELDGATADPAQVERCYAALSRFAPGQPDAGRSDLNGEQIKSRFRRGRGLVRSSHGWLRPDDVFRGTNIFGERRPHVATAGAEALWKLVGVEKPDLSDCAEVLVEISKQPATPATRGELLGIYRHMTELVRGGEKTSLALASLPLLTDAGWTSDRPIYTALDHVLEETLAQTGAPVWRPPGRPALFEALLPPLRVEMVDDRTTEPLMPGAEAIVRGAALQDDYASAVEHFSDYLTTRAVELHESIEIPWVDLRMARVAVAPDLKQRVQLDHGNVVIPCAASVIRNPLTFCVRSEDDVGSSDAGGMAIANLFPSANREYVALVWVSAWMLALSGQQALGLQLPQREEASDPLEEWLKNRPTSGKKTEKTSRVERASADRPKAGKPGPAAPDQPPRELAPLEEIIAKLKDVEYVPGQDGGAGSKKTKPTTLRKPGKPGDPGTGPGSSSRRRNFNNADVEALGYRVLEDRLREWFGLELVDQHRLQRVGSDAVDELAGFWVELKAHSEELSDTEVLTAHEAKRAYEQGKRYLLAVVSGLETGAEPQIRLFADPIRTLDYYPDRSIRLAGIKKKRSVKRIGDRPS